MEKGTSIFSIVAMEKSYLMKKYLILFTLLASIVSCSSDSHGEMGNMGTVRYRVVPNGSAAITSVKYRSPNGSLLTETPVDGTQWSKDIEVHKPFNANMTATITNSVDDSGSGIELKIFLDGQEIESNNVVIPVGASQHSLSIDVE